MNRRIDTRIMLFEWNLIKVAAIALTLSMAALMIPAHNISASRSVLSDVDCVVQPSIVANLGVAAPGLISQVHFDRADFVTKGTVLVELNSNLEAASLQLAQHLSQSTAALKLRTRNADFTQRTLQRNQSLYEKASVSGQTLDQIRTELTLARLQQEQEQDNLESARLEANRARIALNRRFIVSPFDGAITERFKSIGEYVADEPVLQIVQLDPLRIEVVVLVEHLNTIEVGMSAEVQLRVPDFEDDRMIAKVRRIDPVADAASGTYGVWLEMENPDLKIPSGVRCQLNFLAS